jgi:DNA-directed RNA polymerase specialized sigma subunit
MRPDRHASEDELVRAHLHLASQAVSELARRLPAHVNRDDLSSAAMLGLAQAARSWDPGRGASFERHAATRIRGALPDDLLPSGDRGPDHVLVDRERRPTCPTPCSPCPNGCAPW